MRKLESYAYVLLGLGTLLDHVSTHISLRYTCAYETSAFTIWLMERNLWMYFDFTYSAIIILSCYYLLQRFDFEGNHVILLTPYIIGTVRLCAAIWNTALILYQLVIL